MTYMHEPHCLSHKSPLTFQYIGYHISGSMYLMFEWSCRSYHSFD